MLRVIEESLAPLACQTGLYCPALSLSASLALRAGEARNEERGAAATERPLHRGVLPEDQPLRDGFLCVAVKPSQRLVLGVLREDAVCSLVQEAESLEGFPVLHWARHECLPLLADVPPQTCAVRNVCWEL